MSTATIHYVQCDCGASFRIHASNRSLAKGTCPACKRSVEVSLEREEPAHAD